VGHTRSASAGSRGAGSRVPGVCVVALLLSSCNQGKRFLKRHESKYGSFLFLRLHF
jgi:hypothetical protein